MSKPKSIYNIFIGSPGDIIEERKTARDTVASLNRSIRRELSCAIDIYGWEDVPPTVGRPQAVINRDIEACDVFIGVLHTRWGSETGECSSGFEEEFKLAMALRGKLNKPEIWLYFKNVDPNQARDPGPQLTRVLEFKSERIKSRDVIFKEFNDASSWQLLFFEHLNEFILRNSKEPQDTSGNSKRLPVKIPPPTSGLSTSKVIKDLSRLQIIETLENMSSLAKEHTDFQSHIPDLTYSRILLLTSEKYSVRDGNYTVGTHEINSLYKEKETLKLSQREMAFLLKVLLTENNDLVPGWYFFRNIPIGLVEAFAFGLLVAEYPEHLREKALNFILTMKLSPNENLIRDQNILDKIEIPEGKRTAFLEHLLNTEDEFNGEYINERLQARFPDHFLVKNLLSEANDNPVIVIGKLDSGTFSSSELKRITWSLESMASQIPTQFLRARLSSHLDEVKYLCFKLLSERRELTDSDLEFLRSTNEYRYKALGINYRISVNGEFVDPKFIKEELEGSNSHQDSTRTFAGLLDRNHYLHLVEKSLSNKSYEDLLLSIDWYTVYNEEAYTVLIQKYGKKYEKQFKIDVESDFESIHQASRSKLIARFGDLIHSHLEDWDKPDTLLYKRAGFQKVALGYAIKNNIKWAIKSLVPKCIKNGYWSTEDKVIESLRKYPGYFTEEFLESLLKRFSGYKRQVIQEVILRRFGSFDKNFQKMFDSSDADEFSLAARLARKKCPDRASKYVKQYLWDKNATIRLAALSLVSNKATDAKLKNILQEYNSGDTYFYDIVCWLDRMIYAPNKIRAEFKKMILSKTS